MPKTRGLLIVALALASALFAQQGDSLADLARKQREAKKDAKSKKVYTDEDLQHGAAGRSADGASAGSAGKAPRQEDYKKEEGRALKYVCAVSVMQMSCRINLKHACSWDEMLKGVNTGFTSPGSAKREWIKEDRRNDPTYEYRLTTSGENFELAAVPKRPGLGGFLKDKDEGHYNAAGPASKSDPRTGATYCTELFDAEYNK